jgi:AcrR family transcriptional regulator
VEAAVQGRGQRRAAILEAALECFAEHGFAATTVEQIRARSGASVGSIYHHFGGKEQLAAQLYLDGLRGYQRGVLGALEQHPQAQAAIHALVRHHLGWVQRNPRLARFLMNRRETELRSATEARVRELNRRFVARVATWMQTQVQAGALRALPPDLWEPVLLGPSQELARLWLAGRTQLTLREAEHELAQTTWRAVKGDRT